MPDATVGFVAYRRPRELAAALERVVCADLEVVVVNVGRDPAISRVARDAPPHVHLEETENRGYAAAVNVIARCGGSDVVVFCNDDAQIGAKAVRDLALVVSSGDADVAVPRVVDRDGQPARTIAAVPNPRSLVREWLAAPDLPIPWIARWLRVEKWRAPRDPEPIEAAAAVVVAARRSLLLEEPLPEDYFLYWEESEWFWRLRERGAVVQYRPEIVCMHDGGRDDVRPEKSRLMARNAIRCVRRTQGRPAGFAAVVIVIAWNLRLVLGDGLRYLVGRDPRRGSRVRARCAGLWAALTSWGELR